MSVVLPVGAGDRGVPRMRRVALVGILAVLAAGAACAVALAAPTGLDRSFGKHGVVEIKPPFPGGLFSEARIHGFAAAPDGSAYALGEESCFKRGCNHHFLARYGPRGGRDRSFGGGNALVLPAAPEPALGTDSAGRAVLATVAGPTVSVRRLTLAGHPDRGFGHGGTVRYDCGCGAAAVHLFRAPAGRSLVDASTVISMDHREAAATRVVLTRLLPDGRLDRGFGKGGTTRFTIKGPGPPHSVVVGPRGAIYFGGPGCCGRREIYLDRVSADGGIDRRFDRIAARAVRRLGARGKTSELAALAPRAGGGLDVLAASDADGKGLDLRLGADGRLDLRFAKRGVLRLPFYVEAAVAGAGGSVIVAGFRPFGAYRAFLIRRGGSFDPSFHRAKGVLIPIFGVPLRLATQARGQVLVTDQGRRYCRNSCDSEPAMARLLE